MDQDTLDTGDAGCHLTYGIMGTEAGSLMPIFIPSCPGGLIDRNRVQMGNRQPRHTNPGVQLGDHRIGWHLGQARRQSPGGCFGSIKVIDPLVLRPLRIGPDLMGIYRIGVLVVDREVSRGFLPSEWMGKFGVCPSSLTKRPRIGS